MRAVLILMLLAAPALAHDDGQYAADAKTKAWFNTLKSGNDVLCCSATDGRTITTDEWGTHQDHYWVIVDGVRYKVPPEAVITVPNMIGTAIVWPYTDEGGKTQIRCFLPGASG